MVATFDGIRCHSVSKEESVRKGTFVTGRMGGGFELF
jgi:hypothetical protein